MAPDRADEHASPEPSAVVRVGYLRLIDPVVRGWVGVVSTVAVFALGGALAGVAGEWVGLLVVSAWILFFGSYCVLNFAHCRETHCVVTGAGWVPLGVLGLVVALLPGEPLPWYRVNVATVAFVVILGIGFALEYAVLARTDRHRLG